MGIGRGEFIRLTGLALAGLVVDPLQSVITYNDTYINKKFGILFEKPSAWGFVEVKRFEKLKAEQILADDMNEIKEEVWEDLGDPICMATKYFQDIPEYKGIFSPTITLNVTPKSELEYLGIESFEELMNASEKGISLILKDIEVLKRYPPYELSGCRFYEIDSTYQFEHVDITEPLKVELKTIRAEHNDFYYDFNCHQSSAQNQLAGKEFEEFKKTIKLI
jgi:hypothetical protein